MSEVHKQLIDLAVAAGRSMQSAETGFLHYFKNKSEAPHQAIPAYENFLFALSLCRTKTVENITEAKGLLDKLLAYQNANGLFPNYLHDYPHCYDRFIGAHLLPVIYWLDHLFHTVFGADLNDRVKIAFLKLVEATLPELDRMPVELQAKMAGVLIASGRSWKKPDWTTAGEKRLPAFSQLTQPPLSFSPAHLSEGCIALTLIPAQAPRAFINWLLQSWHPSLERFCAPYIKMPYQKGVPELTLYDLFMSAFRLELPKRAKAQDPALVPHLLQGALLFAEDLGKIDANIPEEQTASWGIRKSANSSYAWNLASPAPFHLLYDQGKDMLMHTPEAKLVKFTEMKDQLEMEFKFGEVPNLEDRDACRELLFYFPLSEGFHWDVNGIAANTFRSGDALKITDGIDTFHLKFASDENTIIQGHVIKGCRPGELAHFGKNRFAAYDWVFFLRTIKRNPNSILKVFLSHAQKT